MPFFLMRPRPQTPLKTGLGAVLRWRTMTEAWPTLWQFEINQKHVARGGSLAPRIKTETERTDPPHTVHAHSQTERRMTNIPLVQCGASRQRRSTLPLRYRHREKCSRQSAPKMLQYRHRGGENAVGRYTLGRPLSRAVS